MVSHLGTRSWRPEMLCFMKDDVVDCSKMAPESPDPSAAGRRYFGFIRNWRIALAVFGTLATAFAAVVWAVTSGHCDLSVGGAHGWLGIECREVVR